jgi:hypothetical protein
MYWCRNKRGFLAMMNKDFPSLRVFRDIFEREDQERASRSKLPRRPAVSKSWV